MTCKVCYEESEKIVCESCFEEIASNSLEMKEKILESMSLPVFVVKPDTTILSANNQLLEFVGKTIEEVENALGGDVIGCAHAGLPGGCGKTFMCDECDIRNIVTKTMVTEQGVKNASATQTIKRGEKEARLRLKLSTKYKEGFVFVEINDYQII